MSAQLEPDWHADVVVFDPATIHSQEIALRYDLPGGAGRVYADAVGVDHVLVNGVPIVQDGSLAKGRSGTLLRSGADVETPSM